MEGKKRVLMIGGSGYLGQHLLHSLSLLKDCPFHLAFTYHSDSSHLHLLLHSLPACLAFRVDLKSGDGFELISQQFGQPHVVVNCAAISVPRACELDPSAAMSVNVPSSLVKWLSSFNERDTLLIHLSTDQVYEGVKSFYKEEDETVPVNVYGKSKVAAEQFIADSCSNYAILRSSIIYGPQTISPVPKSLPIQWMDNVLSKGEPVKFFHDEFRCLLASTIASSTNQGAKVVKGVNNCSTEIHGATECKQMQLLLNVGGPDRLSRVQMAEAVAVIRGYNRSLIMPVSAATVDRGVLSPADISMDISKLVQTLNIVPTPFRDGVKLTLGGA